MKKRLITLMSLVMCGVMLLGMMAACGSKTWEVKVKNVSNGGSIHISKNLVENGGSVEIDIVPEKDYSISELRVNGVQRASNVVNNKLNITNITENIYIEATFEVGVRYVDTNKAPLIDGEIDDVWSNAIPFVVSKVYDNKGGIGESEINHFTSSQVQVLWNETGLYYLAHIYDFNITELDRCNIWVSEVYSNVTSHYSASASAGNYAICVNPDGLNLLYTGIDVSRYWTVATKKYKDYMYVVEIFMPVIGTNSLKEGNKIGLDISVDFYNSTTNRDVCINWWANGKYWLYVKDLRPVTLLP